MKIDPVQENKLIELLWHSLKPDPLRNDSGYSDDRRMTGWGTKTKQGLIACIESILEPTEGKFEQLTRLQAEIVRLRKEHERWGEEGKQLLRNSEPEFDYKAGNIGPDEIPQPTIVGIDLARPGSDKTIDSGGNVVKIKTKNAADSVHIKQEPPRQFYECGICEYYHLVSWKGDCRDDKNRFTAMDMTDDEYQDAITMQEMDDRDWEEED